MRRSKFTEEQIIAILKQVESGLKTDEVCRQHGISRQTFYRWRSKFGGLEVSEARRLRTLEDENRRLDVTVCSKCGGRMKVLEIVTDPHAIAKLLHGARAPPRPCPPGQLPLFV